MSPEGILRLQLRMLKAYRELAAEGMPERDPYGHVAARALNTHVSCVTAAQRALAKHVVGAIAKRAQAPAPAPRRPVRRPRPAPEAMPPLRWHERLLARLRALRTPHG